MRKINFILFLFLIIPLISYAQINELRDWLNESPEARKPLKELNFSKKPLSKSQSNKAIQLLLADKQQKMLNEYGTQWDNRLI